MKTIIIFCNTSWNIYNFRKNLINNLLKNYNVITISGRDMYSSRVKKISKSYFLDLNNRSINIFKNLKEILQFRKIIKRYPKATLLNFTNKSIIIGTISIFFRKNKVINVVTGLGHSFLQKNILIKILIKIIYVFVNLRSNYIVVQNKFDKKYYQNKLFTKNKIKLIYGSGSKF